MTIGNTLLQELIRETAGLRKYLERIPEDKFGWQPHPKSMTLAALAAHTAEIPEWAGLIVSSESFTIPDDYKPWLPANRDELLAKSDEAINAAKAAMASVSDAEIQKDWSLIACGQTAFTMPRQAVIRSMVLNHLVHHRGQLSVYLRLLDVPLPMVYGPSADEQ